MNRRTRWLGLGLVLLMLAAAVLAAGCGRGTTVVDTVARLAPGDTASTSQATPAAPTSTPPPATTAPPTTQPTTSSAASVPTPSSSASASPSPAPAAGGTVSSLLWLWILLGALVIVALAVLIARRSGRRAALATSWRSRLADACAKGSALYDALRLAEAAGVTAPDAAARWADIQRRADDLAQTLYALRQAAPGELERARVAGVISALQAVRSATDAEHGPGGAAVPPEHVRARLQSFGAALRDLCSPGSPGRG